MSDEIKTLIVDDHPIFRKGLRQVIESDARLKVIGEAENGISALELIENLKPDVVVADVNMPQMGGLELARKIREKNLPVALVFLTMHKDETMFNAAMDAGVSGYVLKDNAVTDITDCIKAVASGRHYITPALSDYLFNRSRKNIVFNEQTDGLNSLTKTERRILRLIAEDKTSREIGELLFIHPRTVDNHRTNISRKLNLHGSHALLRFALKHQSELAD
ncbi:MAG: response regulator transcription factor [Acidobacteria bacterium]|jgi:DNA-binding NarL/FixJ family response regulator|nr:response regulator transcription factor [Acidobacteriota bacterium]